VAWQQNVCIVKRRSARRKQAWQQRKWRQQQRERRQHINAWQQRAANVTGRATSAKHQRKIISNSKQRAPEGVTAAPAYRRHHGVIDAIESGISSMAQL